MVISSIESDTHRRKAFGKGHSPRMEIRVRRLSSGILEALAVGLDDSKVYVGK
jgi:hypothetical protein